MANLWQMYNDKLDADVTNAIQLARSDIERFMLVTKPPLRETMYVDTTPPDPVVLRVLSVTDPCFCEWLRTQPGWFGFRAISQIPRYGLKAYNHTIVETFGEGLMRVGGWGE